MFDTSSINATCFNRVQQLLIVVMYNVISYDNRVQNSCRPFYDKDTELTDQTCNHLAICAD